MKYHPASWFVTLTYADKHLPQDLSLDPKVPLAFLKRLRRKVEPEKIRYYVAGEYGSDGGRPHYHMALYGYPELRHYNPRDAHLQGIKCKCAVCSAWGMGGVLIMPLDEKSAGYICKYVTKFGKEAEDSVKGRHPEFARMSRKPGIGAKAAQEFVAAIDGTIGRDVYIGSGSGDVPVVYRVGRKLRPMGRYLRGKIREAMGLSGGEPSAVGRRRKEELQAELCEDGARARREAKRDSDAHRLAVLEEMSNTKGKR